MEPDPWATIEAYLQTGEYHWFGVTAMPGPQLQQAIPFSQKVKTLFPETVVIWGGYFATNQYKVVIESPFVDVVINGPGDEAFPRLLEALTTGSSIADIPNLIFQDEKGSIVRTKKAQLMDQDALPELPYDYLNQFYPLQKYLANTYLGKRTLAYHASLGCPFTCSFCAVVPIYEARWKGKSAENIYQDVKKIKETYGADAVEFHDNNFFVSEKRVAEFSRLMMNEGMTWWGEGRIDTIDKYSDDTLRLMRAAGCKMIFFGAESGSDKILAEMDKGGTQTAAQIKRFAARMRQFDIVPEYSFVLGMPAPTPGEVMAQIDADIEFIKTIKEVNPDTEIIIYIYSPVPTEGSELYQRITEAGFSFPEKLEDWLQPAWQAFDLRKNPLTPWLRPEMVDKIRNFETVLNAYYPTVADTKLTRFQRQVMRWLSSVRYKTGFYTLPYELKALQKFWLRYRQPEIEGF